MGQARRVNLLDRPPKSIQSRPAGEATKSNLGSPPRPAAPVAAPASPAEAYAIEDDIPLPDASRLSRVAEFPWAQLKVGQSFFVPNARGKASGVWVRYAKRHYPDRAFVARGEGAGVRIWRVAPTTAKG